MLRVLRAGKARHVHPDFGQDGGRADGSGRRQGEQQPDGVFLFGHQSGDADFHPMDRLLQVGEVLEQFAQELPLVRLYAPRSGQP
jgi:hypothetical protein